MRREKEEKRTACKCVCADISHYALTRKRKAPSAMKKISKSDTCDKQPFLCTHVDTAKRQPKFYSRQSVISIIYIL